MQEVLGMTGSRIKVELEDAKVDLKFTPIVSVPETDAGESDQGDEKTQLERIPGQRMAVMKMKAASMMSRTGSMSMFTSPISWSKR